MSNAEIVEEVLQLNPQDRYMIVEKLLQSLDKPDDSIDNVWEDEAEKRLSDYKNNPSKTISFNDVFNT